MRHKKLFVLCISIVVIIIASLVSVIKYKTNKQEDFIVMLGNDFSNVKVNTKIDKTFVSNFMESDYLLKIVSQDASKIVEGKVLKMSSLIKKSNIAFISIGTNDIKNLIKVDEKTIKLTFDEEIIIRKIDVMLFNVSKIVKEIKNTNQNINIYLLKMNYFLNYKNEKIESYVDLINEKYKNIANII